MSVYVYRGRSCSACNGTGREAGGLRVLTFADLTFDTELRVVTRGGRTAVLSPRRASLLALLMAAPGRLVTRGELVRRIWGVAPCPRMYATAAELVYELRARVEQGGQARLIWSVYGEGYVLDETPRNERVGSGRG